MWCLLGKDRVWIERILQYCYYFIISQFTTVCHNISVSRCRQLASIQIYLLNICHKHLQIAVALIFHVNVCNLSVVLYFYMYLRIWFNWSYFVCFAGYEIIEWFKKTAVKQHLHLHNVNLVSTTHRGIYCQLFSLLVFRYWI